MKTICLLVLLAASVATASAQVLPTPKSVVSAEGFFELKAGLDIESVVKTDIDTSLADEGYRLEITPGAINITGGSDAGLFYGRQSLQQLMESVPGSGLRRVACQRIDDKPVYGWRSFMLDSGRQYQTVGHIKRTLDWMARYKLNVFHWHLTESMGWRIEIKSQPKLTAVGSQVYHKPEQHGFYSQGEIRDIVAYARRRNITIVPEIDVPGHAFAMMASYPEFSCHGKVDPDDTSRPTRFNTIVCAGKAENDNYQFLGSIFNEVCDLFPDSPYIHTGGDEAPKTFWNKCPHCQAVMKKQGLKNMHELQIHFTNRIADILKKRGKKAICWDDVIAKDGGPDLADNVVVHWWNYRSRKDRMVFKALKMNREVILNPNYYTYINFPITPFRNYTKVRTFGLETCYLKNPASVGMSPKISDEQRKLILGIGTCLWTDDNLVQGFLDIRTFPRVFALSELMWHGKPTGTIEDLRALVDAQQPWLKANGYVSGRAEASDGPSVIPADYNEENNPREQLPGAKPKKKKKGGR